MSGGVSVIRAPDASGERIVARARTLLAAGLVAISLGLLPSTDQPRALGVQLIASILALGYSLAVEILVRRRETDIPRLSYVTTGIDLLAIIAGTLAVSLSAGRPDFPTKSPGAFLFFVVIAAAGLRQSQRLVWFATALSAGGFLLFVVPALLYVPDAVVARGLGMEDLSSQRVGLARVALVTFLIVISGAVIAFMAQRMQEISRANAVLFAEIEAKSSQLALASRHKSEFLANMSHELRTPLNAVIGFSDVLDQQMFGALNPRQAEYIRDISSAGQHLLGLVNDVLDLSKVEAGRMELDVSEFAVAPSIVSTLQLVRERAMRHGIELVADVPDDLGEIVADERKVRQVVLNLLSNAVKFTPDGGRVGLTARRRDGGVEISVRDSGIGIAPGDQARVFDEFRQVGAPSERAHEGTGLGLTLAKRFIELHGGRIWLESELGKGTTFTFFVPAVKPPASSTLVRS